MARLEVNGSESVAHYHCISRVVERRFALGDQELIRLVAKAK